MKATPSTAFSSQANNAHMRIGGLNYIRDPAMQ
jgi:hypothetical protein